MKSVKILLSSLTFLLLWLLAGCNLPEPGPPPPLPPTPTATQMPLIPSIGPEFPVVLPTLPPVSRGVFKLAVLVDLNSEPVTRDQARSLVTEASQILFVLTDFTYQMVDFQETRNVSGMDQMVSDYLAGSPATIPNGIIIFSFGDDNRAKLYGGYSFSHPGPGGFQNAFQSPYAPEGSVYIAVIHFGHRFSQCGYGDSDTPVSSVSIDGECRNQSGIACVPKNGYQMCSNAVDDLYASTPTYFAAATFVHEIMHPFGPGGDRDHYWTRECTASMATGVSRRPYNSLTFDQFESNSYVEMCPFVFDNFVNSYQPTVSVPTVTPTAPVIFSIPTFTFSKNAFCRKGPSVAYEDVTAFLQGQSVQIDGRNQDEPRWWWVLIPASSGHCWVSDSTGSASGPLDGVKVVSAPPLPPSPTPTATPLPPTPTPTATPKK